MKIRKGVTVFCDGALTKVDLDEKGRVVVGDQPQPAAAEPVKTASHAAPHKEPQPPTGDKKPTKQELMAQLKAAGISFKATMGNAELTALLPVAVQQPQPAAAEPVKAAEGGTGDQDVI